MVEHPQGALRSRGGGGIDGKAPEGTHLGFASDSLVQAGLQSSLEHHGEGGAVIDAFDAEPDQGRVRELGGGFWGARGGGGIAWR